MAFSMGRVVKVVLMTLGGLFALVVVVGVTRDYMRDDTRTQPVASAAKPLTSEQSAVDSNAAAREAAQAAAAAKIEAAKKADRDASEAAAEIEKNWPKTLDAAIDLFKPSMDDHVDKASDGTMMLVTWCAEHLKWSEFKRPVVGSRPPAKIRKDVEDARGKIICTPLGRIIQIKKEKIGETPAFFTGLLRPGRELIHFYAVGSTGDLVERDSAKICGVVTGVFDYHNSMGGIGHAIELVGMFDLPENRKAR